MPGRAEVKLELSWKAHARRSLLRNGERVGGLCPTGASVLQVEERMSIAKGQCARGKAAEPPEDGLGSEQLCIALGSCSCHGQCQDAKAVTPPFPNFSSARWACSVKAKLLHNRMMKRAALKLLLLWPCLLQWLQGKALLLVEGFM